MNIIVYLMVLLTISQLATACSSKQEEYEQTQRALQKLQEEMREQTRRREQAEKKTNKIIQDMEARLKEEERLKLELNREITQQKIGQMKKQQTIIESANNTVQFFMSEIEKADNHISTEQTLIEAWRNRLVQLNDDIVLGGGELIGMMDFDYGRVYNAINDLKEACQNYMDKRIPRRYKRRNNRN